MVTQATRLVTTNYLIQLAPLRRPSCHNSWHTDNNDDHSAAPSAFGRNDRIIGPYGFACAMNIIFRRHLPSNPSSSGRLMSPTFHTMHHSYFDHNTLRTSPPAPNHQYRPHGCDRYKAPYILASQVRDQQGPTLFPTFMGV
jgi:hypothetical protein